MSAKSCANHSSGETLCLGLQLTAKLCLAPFKVVCQCRPPASTANVGCQGVGLHLHQHGRSLAGYCQGVNSVLRVHIFAGYLECQ